MSTRWEHYSHGADVGVRGIGATLEEALAAAALATTAVVVPPDTIRAETPVTIECSGVDPEDLLYSWLNSLIFEMATRRMLFRRFDIQLSGGNLKAVAWGERVSPVRHMPAVEVKGATYTTLSVRQDGPEWVAECVVDV